MHVVEVKRDILGVNVMCTAKHQQRLAGSQKLIIHDTNLVITQYHSGVEVAGLRGIAAHDRCAPRAVGWWCVKT